MATSDLISHYIYKFGPFELVPHLLILKTDNEVLHLEPKIFKLLHILVLNHGSVVTKEILLTEVWLNVEVSDSAITRAIKELRKLLTSYSSINSWIQTHYGQGYQFIINVEVFDFSALEINQPSKVTSRMQLLIIWQKFLECSRVYIKLISGSFLLLFALLFFYFSKTTEIGSIAVLPIKNMSENAELDYLSVGLTDLLIGKLAELPHLKVISRTSSMSYSAVDKSAKEIGEELLVDYLVEGSLIRKEKTILVNLRLMESQSEKLVWSKYFEKSIDNTSELYTEVVEVFNSYIRQHDVDTAMLWEKTPSENQHKTDSVTYQLYLEGVYYLRIRRSINILKARDLLLEVVERDETYAPAWASLAHSHIQLANYSAAGFIDSLTKAKLALDRALQLDPNLAEAWSALGQYEFGYNYDWPKSKQAFQRSLQLNPGNSSALQWYAEVLAVTGEADKSLQNIQKAFEVDPLNPIIVAVWGICLSLAGEQEKAIEKYEFALALNPKFFWIHRNISYSFAKLGNDEQALAHRLLEMKKAGVHSPEELQRLKLMTEENGFKGFWQWSLETLFEQKKEWFIPLTLIAESYAGIDDYDNMLRWLRLAIKEKGEYPPHWLMRSPEFAKFKNRAEFQEIVKALNLSLDRL